MEQLVEFFATIEDDEGVIKGAKLPFKGVVSDGAFVRWADDVNPEMVRDHVFASGAAHYFPKEKCWGATLCYVDAARHPVSLSWVLHDPNDPPDTLEPATWGETKSPGLPISSSLIAEATVRERMYALPEARLHYLWDKGSNQKWLDTLLALLTASPSGAYVETADVEMIETHAPLDHFHVLEPLRPNEKVQRIVFHDHSQILLVVGGVRHVVETVIRCERMEVTDDGAVASVGYRVSGMDGYYGTA